MKIIKGLLISLVILVVLVIAAAAVFFATFDVNRYKPMIVSQAKAVLNRDLDFKKASLGFSFSKGVSVKLSDVTIGEDPTFSKGNFFSVKDISLGVDVLGYLLRKRVDISDVLIDAPRVTVIRQKDGLLNVMSLAKPASAQNKTGPVSASAPAVSPVALPAILVSAIRVTHGTITYEDRSFDPAMSVEVADATVSVDHLSLAEPFAFVVEGTVLSTKKNIKIEGKAQVDLKTNNVTVSGLKVSTDLSELILEKVPVVFPMAKGAVLPTALKGMAGVVVDKLTAGPKGLGDVSADVSLADGQLQFKELALPIKDVLANVKVTLSKVTLDKVSAAIGDGSIKASGTIDDYLVTQAYDLMMSAEKLKIQDFMSQDKAAVKAEGVISADLKVKGAGFTPEAVKSTLSGEGKITGTAIKLKDINVLRVVLDKISVIPNLSEKVQANLPDKYKQDLTQPDTVLSDISLPLVIQNGQIVINDLQVSSNDFMFKGKAAAGFDGSFSAEGSFLVPAEFSKAMVAGVSQLQYLLNPAGQIYIPVKVSGKSPEMHLSVDLEYLGKKLLVNQAQTQLIKVLDKALGQKATEPAASGQSGAAQATAPQDGSASVTDLVSGIFGSVLKK